MTLATKITLARIALIPLYMIFMYASNGAPGVWMWLSFVIFMAASLTDYADGYVARKYNQISDFGKFLDPLADKLLTVAAMLMFCQWGSMPAWALMVILTREFAVTGLRLIAVGKGSVIAAAWSGKIKTTCTMIGLCAMMAFPTVLALHGFVTAVIVISTLYSGVEYFYKNWSCLLDKPQK